MSRFGATCKFPRGMLNADDEGEMTMGVAHRDKTVLLNFGKPIAWIGLDAATARQLGETLIQHANDVEAGR